MTESKVDRLTYLYKMYEGHIKQLRAENEQLRAAIVAWNEYDEATAQHAIAQREHDRAASDESRGFWADAIVTQSAKWSDAIKRLDAMGAWRGSHMWKY